MATEPVLLMPEDLQAIQGHISLTEEAAARIAGLRYESSVMLAAAHFLDTLLSHIAALTLARDAAIQRAETAERARDLHATTAYESGYAAAVAEMEKRIDKLGAQVHEVVLMARAKLGGG